MTHTVDNLVLDYRLRPGYCLIEPQAHEEQSEGGIYYPGSCTTRTKWHDDSWGRVLAVGEPKRTKSGVPIDPGFETGDWVIFCRWNGMHFESSDGRIVVLACQEDVEAIIYDN